MSIKTGVAEFCLSGQPALALLHKVVNHAAIKPGQLASVALARPLNDIAAADVQTDVRGPPDKIAVATPTMEPVPSVEARDVTIAPKLLRSPSALSSLVRDNFKARGSLR